MKFRSFRNGHLGLLIIISFLVSGCNPEEYFPVEEFVTGDDAYCSIAKDLNSCQDLGDKCQAAFLDLEKDDMDLVFAACVSNPGYSDPSDPSSPIDGNSEPDNTAVTSEDPAAPAAPLDPSVPVVGETDSGSTIDGTTDPAIPPEPRTVATITEAWKSNCQINEKYLYVKKFVSKNKTQTQVKVKICHSTDRGEHTIIIACPALKAHAKHHDGDDYLGACK
jgi:hypothetical protein